MLENVKEVVISGLVFLFLGIVGLSMLFPESTDLVTWVAESVFEVAVVLGLIAIVGAALYDNFVGETRR